MVYEEPMDQLKCIRKYGGNMIRCVYRDPRFDRQLDALRKAGKKNAIAAKKADKIIQNLALGWQMLSEIGMLTKNGEFRIKKCIKYDLGRGYRLITIRKADLLFVSFIGTHDECDRWLENNRRLRLGVVERRSLKVSVSQKSFENTLNIESHPPIDDDPYIYPIEEKYLRMIFCGLSSQGIG